MIPVNKKEPIIKPIEALGLISGLGLTAYNFMLSHEIVIEQFLAFMVFVVIFG